MPTFLNIFQSSRACLDHDSFSFLVFLLSCHYNYMKLLTYPQIRKSNFSAFSETLLSNVLWASFTLDYQRKYKVTTFNEVRVSLELYNLSTTDTKASLPAFLMLVIQLPDKGF